ncbi:hypothetical protein B0T10DRAFT_466204 [Thelonectria olida]|uniref:FAD dependent oxidoreductase domain-containing protein n=1 Tax=Thelonectria olida TaxID=1576542 RepID=A0A9P9AKU6_9HYPO|nr:hypothetical protein B0T10DRAFT_466204 [Thelonectria olida]
MASITILGAGITGLAIPSQLPRRYEITIIAKDLPGDPDSTEWASPWAGGIWMPIYGSRKPDQKIQLEAVAYLLRLAKTNPKSSAQEFEASGVKFKRAHVLALSDLDGMGHNIPINASGVGARLLKDVKDKEVIPIRSETVLVRTNYDKPDEARQGLLGSFHICDSLG